MELMSRIIKIDSCLSIYSYLMLFGKTTPAELRNATGLSKATMFRSLALMSEAGVLAHEEDSEVADKRYSQHYYISQNIIEMSKELSSPGLASYAESQGRAGLVAEWIRNLEFLPATLNQHTTQLLISMSCQEEVKESSPNVVTKLMVFRVDEGENPGEVLKSLQDFVEWFDGKHKTKRRDWRKPIRNPVVLSMSLVSLDSAGR